jgi:hypothetical protein
MRSHPPPKFRWLGIPTVADRRVQVPPNLCWKRSWKSFLARPHTMKCSVSMWAARVGCAALRVSVCRRATPRWLGLPSAIGFVRAGSMGSSSVGKSRGPHVGKTLDMAA